MVNKGLLMVNNGYYLVGGFKHLLFFPYIGNNHPN